MSFKLFPCSQDKLPLIKGWQELATNSQEQLRIWSEQYNGVLKWWGVPTGSPNRIIVLDVDVKNNKNGFEFLKSLGYAIPHTMSQKTPSGGHHFIFNYPNDGKHYGNKVNLFGSKETHSGIDVRGEGGYICFYGTDQTPIADAPIWLLEGCLKPAYDEYGDVIKISPEVAQGILESSLEAIREAEEGSRNDTINQESFKVGQLIASGAITKEFAFEALYSAAILTGEKPYHIKATIESGLNGGQKKPLRSPFKNPVIKIDIPKMPEIEERWTPRYFTKSELLNFSNLKKPQLFKDWSTEDIHITTADGGTGKTTLKLFEAVCLALGESFLGFECVTPGKTLFITGEDTASKLGAMLGAICKQMRITENEEKLNIILNSIVVKKDADLCLILKDRQGFLHPNEAALEKVMQAVDDINPKMIVFDPISSFWGSEAALNDMAKAVSRFMQRLTERSKACVEMINHMGKQSSQNKDMTQFAGRGGTGLPSHSRVSRVLRPVYDEEFTELTGKILDENQSAMMCNVSKFSDGSPLLNKPFIILRQGFLFERITLAPQKERKEQQKIADTERVFEFIKAMRAQNKYPGKKAIIGYFTTHEEKLSKARVEHALNLLLLNGHMGYNVKQTDSPDLSASEKVFVITDADGEEI